MNQFLILSKLLTGLYKSIARWIEPGRLKGPLNVTNLKVNTIIAPAGFKLSLPLEVGNAKAIENIYVGKLNGVDLKKFLNNVVKVEDTMSLTNVTFSKNRFKKNENNEIPLGNFSVLNGMNFISAAGGLEANQISASETSFSLQEKITEGYMGSKEIIGTLESQALKVPDVLQFPSSNIPVNIITNGQLYLLSFHMRLNSIYQKKKIQTNCSMKKSKLLNVLSHIEKASRT